MEGMTSSTNAAGELPSSFSHHSGGWSVMRAPGELYQGLKKRRLKHEGPRHARAFFELPEVCMEVITSYLSLVDARVARGTSARWAKIIKPAKWCRGLGLYLTRKKDCNILLPTPKRLLTLEVWPHSIKDRRQIIPIAAEEASKVKSLKKIVFRNFTRTYADLVLDLLPLGKLTQLEDLSLLDFGRLLGPRWFAPMKIPIMPTLLRLDLTESNLPVENLVELLSPLTELRELKLEGCSNAKEHVVLQTIVRMVNLQKLNMSEIGLRPAALQLEGLGQQPSITWLDLTDNKVGRHDLEVISRLPSLQRLRLGSNWSCKDVTLGGLQWFETARPDVNVQLQAHSITSLP
jgi:hypothetical protein